MKPGTGDPIKRACEILVTVATDRSLTYRCLSRIFTYPDLELVDFLQSGELVIQMKQITTWLGEDQKILLLDLEKLVSSSKVPLDVLQKDYHRFFEMGVERISPRESSYRWKNAGAMAQSESDLRQLLNVQYKSIGVSCESGIEDHIAVELEFLAFLCEQESLRWSTGSTEAARNLRSQERSFVDNHIACWLPEFCFSVNKRYHHTIYGQAAVFCDRWLDLDHGQSYRTLMAFE